MTVQSQPISSFDDDISVQAVIDRFNELEDMRDNAKPESVPDTDALAELASLSTLLSDLADCGGGDVQWAGFWYPGQLIRDSYFQTYAQELAEDCCMINDSAKWPYTCIDWVQAARELRMDYTCVDFLGVTYWCR